MIRSLFPDHTWQVHPAAPLGSDASALQVPVQGVASPDPPPTYSDVDVRGRRRNWFGVLAVGALCAVLAWEAYRGMGNVLTYVFLAMLALSLLTQVRLLLWPPRLTVQEGVLHVRGLHSFRVPVPDVADLRLVNANAQILLTACGGVEPPGMQQLVAGTGAKHGFHYSLPSGAFARDQVDRVRQALGMPPLGAEDDDPLTIFESALHRRTPHVVVTPLLVLANVLIFAALLWADRSQPGPFEWTILHWGANLASETTHGQWWRLVTCMFLHFNLLHVGFNMWVLWDIGRLVERLLGNVAFAVVYLTAGFFGSVASVLWHDHAISAGASGAVFGLFGVLLGFLLPRNRSIPVEVIQSHRNSVFSFLFLNLLLGLSVPWIDMSAHVGGLVAGLVCGLLLTQDLRALNPSARRLRTGLVAGVAVVACVATVYFLPQRSSRLNGGLLKTDLVDRWAEATIHDLERQRRSGKQSADGLAPQAERQVVVAYEQLERELADSRWGPEEQAERDRLVAYVRLRCEGLQLASRARLLVQQGMALEKLDQARALYRTAPDRRPACATEPPTSFAAEVARFAAMESRVLQRWNEVLAQLQRQELSDARAANVIEQEVLQVWREGHKRFRNLSPTFNAEHRLVGDSLLRYLRLREEGWDLQVAGLREGNPDKLEESQRKAEQAAEACQQFQEAWKRLS